MLRYVEWGRRVALSRSCSACRALFTYAHEVGQVRGDRIRAVVLTLRCYLALKGTWEEASSRVTCWP